jgi:hypothetical protein
VPTKGQILTILDSAPAPMTRAHLLIAAARLYGVQPTGQRRNEAVTWARSVIDYAATERLLAAMEMDGLVEGMEAFQWKELGQPIGGAQARTTYFMSARKVLALRECNDKHQDDILWMQAATAADHMLRTLHTAQWERFRAEAYAALQKGLPWPQQDAQEPS